MLREEHEVPVPPLRGGGDDDGDGPQMEDVAQRRYVLPFPISDRRGQHLQLKLLLSPNLGTLGLKTDGFVNPRLLTHFKFLQRSAKVGAPGFVNAAGKLRQEW